MAREPQTGEIVDQQTMVLCLIIVGLILVLMFFIGPDRGDD